MLSNALQNNCTVTRRANTKTAGVSSYTTTTIYTNIPCHIYSVGGKVYDSSLAVYTKDKSIRIIVGPTHTLIRQGDFIEVTDPTFGVLGNYEVQDVPKANRMHNGSIDSIQLNLKS